MHPCSAAVVVLLQLSYRGYMIHEISVMRLCKALGSFALLPETPCLLSASQCGAAMPSER